MHYYLAFPLINWISWLSFFLYRPTEISDIEQQQNISEILGVVVYHRCAIQIHQYEDFFGQCLLHNIRYFNINYITYYRCYDIVIF